MKKRRRKRRIDREVIGRSDHPHGDPATRIAWIRFMLLDIHNRPIGGLLADAMSKAKEHASSSFTAKRVNQSTFVIREDDLYEEHPLIYVKIHCKVPLIILSDTGCNEPSEKHKKGSYIRV